jgi:hypothetical protein
MTSVQTFDYWMDSAAWWRNEAYTEMDDIERLQCLSFAFTALRAAWQELTEAIEENRAA